MTLTYRLALATARVMVEGRGPLSVDGADHIPRSGPTLIIANHDTPLDALVVGVAARRHRQVRFLAKRSLWERQPLGAVLDRLQQIPIERGRQKGGLDAAVEALRAGHCVCVFPEGTLSRGRTLRVRSGAARLLAAVPETRLIGCAVTGAGALTSLRHRPRVRVAFLPHSREPLHASYEASIESVENSMRAIRAIAPPWP
ncbi:lysophospholipid acyltransferase family protein [Streptomyces sp. NPDC055796]